MNVLIVIPELSYRGGERIFYTLAKGLAKKGHQVSLLAGRVKSDAFSVKPPIKLIKPAIWVNKILQNNLIFLLLQFPLLFFLIQANTKKVDIIHTESGFALWAAVLARWIRGVRIVWMVFAFESKPFRGSFWNNFFSYSYRQIDKFFAKGANAYTCIAPRIPKALKRVYGIKNVKVTIPAIDSQRFKNANPQIIIEKFHLKGKKMLLHPASLHLKKNQELSINSMVEVVKEFPETVLILLGDGPDRERLERLITDKKLEKNVIFAGVAKMDSIKDFYVACDLVLVTSYVENEGLSMTALEALANGKLPIVARGAGVAEIFESKGIGIVVEPNVNDYSRVIVSCLRKPTEYEKIVEKGKYWVSRELKLGNFASQSLKVYKACLK